jgi:hypothetical protein
MLNIKRTYIVDEHDKKIAVQVDVETFEKMEEALENYALVALMKEDADGKTLSVAEAKTYYQSLDKAKRKFSIRNGF